MDSIKPADFSTLNVTPATRGNKVPVEFADMFNPPKKNNSDDRIASVNPDILRLLTDLGMVQTDEIDSDALIFAISTQFGKMMPASLTPDFFMELGFNARASSAAIGIFEEFRHQTRSTQVAISAVVSLFIEGPENNDTSAMLVSGFEGGSRALIDYANNNDIQY